MNRETLTARSRVQTETLDLAAVQQNRGATRTVTLHRTFCLSHALHHTRFVRGIVSSVCAP